MGYIYKISNDINNKIYIGQTVNSIEYRFKHHINEAKNEINKQNKFHKALLELGTEHFRVELIEECPNDKLNEKERYWIKFYNSVYTGYNTTWGGSCGVHYDRNELLNIWNQGHNLQEISNIIGIDRGLLGIILKSEGISQEEINERRYNSMHIQNKNRAIYQINPNTGEIIDKWFSIAEASRQLNINHSIIVNCCQKKPQAKTAGGFAWRYIEDYNEKTDKEELIQYVIRDLFKNTKHVLQYDNNNNLIREFNSTKEAGEMFNKTSGNIARYCRGERKDPNGYIWKYKD